MCSQHQAPAFLSTLGLTMTRVSPKRAIQNIEDEHGP